jgi:hypothetical protein
VNHDGAKSNRASRKLPGFRTQYLPSAPTDTSDAASKQTSPDLLLRPIPPINANVQRQINDLTLCKASVKPRPISTSLRQTAAHDGKLPPSRRQDVALTSEIPHVRDQDELHSTKRGAAGDCITSTLFDEAEIDV